MRVSIHGFGQGFNERMVHRTRSQVMELACTKHQDKSGGHELSIVPYSCAE